MRHVFFSLRFSRLRTDMRSESRPDWPSLRAGLAFFYAARLFSRVLCVSMVSARHVTSAGQPVRALSSKESADLSQDRHSPIAPSRHQPTPNGRQTPDDQ
ncbi:hypothetical protein EVA_08257 [gut metagenome]|uniref:Uncharacterized protein n=1 Tax=gut metagenome TaxID=749906 RepID=J9G8T2_9ZZZZ